MTSRPGLRHRLEQKKQVYVKYTGLKVKRRRFIQKNFLRKMHRSRKNRSSLYSSEVGGSLRCRKEKFPKEAVRKSEKI